MRTQSAVILLASILLPGVAFGVCGPVAVCGDVMSTFGGETDGETIVATWSTNDESNIAEYRLYSCTSASNCPTLITTITASGSCGVTEPYEYEWEYGTLPHSIAVQVWMTTPSMPACTAYAVPE